jgi:serine/threonine protein kinase
LNNNNNNNNNDSMNDDVIKINKDDDIDENEWFSIEPLSAIIKPYNRQKFKVTLHENTKHQKYFAELIAAIEFNKDIKNESKYNDDSKTDLFSENTISLSSNINEFMINLFVEGEYTCLLFEYVPGQTLTDFLSLPRSNIIKKLIIQQLALAISHLHGVMKIAHLDLKPDNILIVISPKGFPLVKVIDFGLACPFALFAPGAVGTPNYKAPEVSSGFEYDQQADIWSLGMVISFIMTGQVSQVTGTHPKNAIPFQVCTLMQPPIPEQIKSDPEMSWGLSLCKACLQIDPNARPSAEIFVKMCASIKLD